MRIAYTKYCFTKKHVSFSMGTSQTLLNYSRFVKDVYSKTKGVVHIDFEDAQKAVEKMINLYIK